MLSETNSQATWSESYPYYVDDVSSSSLIKKIGVTEVWERPPLSFEGPRPGEPFFATIHLLPTIQFDYSSSIYRFLEFKNETATTEEFFRKVRQAKTIESVSGMLNELDSEQMEIFEAAVKRRPLLNDICA
jgi:hypothetical protein